jgi:hypothetical protein
VLDNLVKFAKFGLMLTASALFVFLCWGVYVSVQNESRVAQATVGTLGSVKATADQAGQEITHLDSGLKPVLANLASASKGLDIAIKEINRPCGGHDSCGTIADVNRSLAQVRLAAGQVIAASNHEKEQLDKINDQETAMAGVATTDLTKLGTAIDSINTLASNKQIVETLSSTAETTKQLAGASAHLNNIADQADKTFHAMTHPIGLEKVVSTINKVPTAVWQFLITKVF